MLHRGLALNPTFYSPWVRKHLVGSSGNAFEEGDLKHKPDNIPKMAYVLPIVGILGMGVAITAYCSLAT